MTVSSPWQAIHAHVDDAPHRVAMRVLELGVWNEHTWVDIAQTVRLAASALQNCGVHEGSTVALLCGSRPEWPLSVWAAHVYGATVVAAPNAIDSANLERLRDHHTPNAWIVEGEQPRGILRSLGVPSETILMVETPNRRGDTATWQHDVIGSTRDTIVRRENESDVALDAQRKALVLFDEDTSWTFADLANTTVVGSSLTLHEDDEYLATLPPTWPSEAFLLAGSFPTAGSTVNFGARSGGGLAEVLAVQPTVLMAPATWWDALSARMTGTDDEPTHRVIDALLDGQGGFTKKLARRSLLRQCGLGRLREAHTLGEITPRTKAFLGALGVIVGEPLSIPRDLATGQTNEPAPQGAS